MKHKLIRPVTIGTLLALATLARAQTNDDVYRSWRWTADVGAPRAAGLAGTFVALADDPSAAVYNPAGLTQMQGTELSGSMISRAGGTVASPLADRIRGVIGVGFAGGAGAITSRFTIGGFLIQPQDRRATLTSARFVDGSVSTGFLDTQVTEAGIAAAWGFSDRLSVGIRLAASHLKLEGENVVDPEALDMGAAAGETRVTGSVGLHATPYRRLRVGFVLHPGVSYRVKRVANRRGAVLDAGSQYDLRQPGVVSAGAAWEVSPRLILVGQADFVRYSEGGDTFLVTAGEFRPADFRREDAIEPRAAIEFSLPVRAGVSLQFRGGVHSQAPGRLAFTGSSAAELSRFRNEARVLIGAAGVSIVTSRGLRLDVAGRFGGEQEAVIAGASVRF